MRAHDSDAAPSCRVRMPPPSDSGTAASAPAHRERPRNLAPLQHVRAFAHPWMFVPAAIRHDDGWLPLIRTLQHPELCSRYMLVEDDMLRAGLGFTGRLLASALLLAIRSGRVLLEVPQVNGTASNLSGTPFSRWCDQPPHTLQCAFEPWTHCAPPQSHRDVVTFETECSCLLHGKFDIDRMPQLHTTNCTGHKDSLLNRGRCLLHHKAAVMRVKLTSIYRLRFLYESPGDAAFSVLRAAQRYLFTPRPWVRALARCFKRQHGLHSGRFLSVHIRSSPEKSAEAARSNKRMPPVKAYIRLTQLVTNVTGFRQVILQTASPRALSEYVAWATTANVSVSYTENPREEGDAWGGWKADDHSTPTAVAAVNLHLTSGAAVLISPTPSVSLWTTLLIHHLGYDSSPNTSHVPRVGGGHVAWHSADLGEMSFNCEPRASNLVAVVRAAAFVVPRVSLVEQRLWNESSSGGCTGRARGTVIDSHTHSAVTGHLRSRRFTRWGEKS